MWNHLKAGRTWSGLVKNRCKNGDFYWVEAHVTPIREEGKVVGYMSVRRRPTPDQVRDATRLYEDLRAGRRQLIGRWSGLTNRLRGVRIGIRIGFGFIALFTLTFAVLAGLALTTLDNQARQGEQRELKAYYREAAARVTGVTLDQALVNRWKEERGIDLAVYRQTIPGQFNSLVSTLPLEFTPSSHGLAEALAGHPSLERISLRDKSLAVYLDVLRDNGQITGVIALALDRQAAVADYLTLRTALVSGGLLALFLITLVSARLSRSITSPLQQATYLFSRISEGYYHDVVDTERDDEVGRVMQALKAMQVKLDCDLNYARRLADEGARVRTALDNVSTNVMIADRNGYIIYLNPAVQRMFEISEQQIRTVLPRFDRHNLLGQSIDLFHRRPEHQRRMLENLKATHRAAITIANRDFDLVANPVVNSRNQTLGTVVEWNDVTDLHQVQRALEGMVKTAQAGDLSGRLDLANREGFFRDLGAGINHLLETVEGAVADIGDALARIATGDLTSAIDNNYQGAFGRIRDSANNTLISLATLVGGIKEAAEAVSSAANEIAAGNADLSRRTEQQAASLEETAATMEQLTATVRQNAANAAQANQLAMGGREVAERGQVLVGEVVATMRSIQESSNRIADIIAVIDGIAFQTNILALNAAVEAARAGEQGRGFSVVAGEVRNLASRSAGAAREIKVLIEDSTTKVQSGSRQVEQAGRTMDDIVVAVKQVTDLMAEISAASNEQSQGIEQINQAVTRMDEGTQQNAALVEQATAAAESLRDQSGRLLSDITVFRIPPNLERHLKSPKSSPSSAHAVPSPVINQGQARLDFAKARSLHMAWRSRLRSFLDGKEELDPQEIVSHRRCPLGQWIYGDGKGVYGNHPDMIAMEEIHASLHESIQRVVQHQRRKDPRAAEAEYEAFMKLSIDLLNMLRTLEQKLGGTPVTPPPPPTPRIAPRVAPTSPRRSGSPALAEGLDPDEWKEF